MSNGDILSIVLFTRSRCETYDAYLVDIQSREEDKFVTQLVNSSNTPSWIGLRSDVSIKPFYNIFMNDKRKKNNTIQTN